MTFGQNDSSWYFEKCDISVFKISNSNYTYQLHGFLTWLPGKMKTQKAHQNAPFGLVFSAKILILKNFLWKWLLRKIMFIVFQMFLKKMRYFDFSRLKPHQLVKHLYLQIFQNEYFCGKYQIKSNILINFSWYNSHWKSS